MVDARPLHPDPGLLGQLRPSHEQMPAQAPAPVVFSLELTLCDSGLVCGGPSPAPLRTPQAQLTVAGEQRCEALVKNAFLLRPWFLGSGF